MEHYHVISARIVVTSDLLTVNRESKSELISEYVSSV